MGKDHLFLKKGTRFYWHRIFLSLLLILLFVSIPIKADANKREQLIIINKTSNELAFFDSGQLVNVYPVATGKTDELTPEGTFKIVNKIKNRPYYTDNIPGGDPANPLGDRWLGIDARGTYGTTYAIHGNNNPKSIGKYISAGCVRMYNDDIRSLFERVKLNTKVIIIKSNQSFESLAKQRGYHVGPAVEVFLDGKKLSVQESPYVENGTLLIPLRNISEALKATVQYEKGKITVSKNKRHVSLTVNDKKAVINGRKVTLHVPPKVIRGHTMVPARVVSEGLGAQVSWDGKNKRVYIVTTNKANDSISVIVNGESLDVGSHAFMENGTVKVPLRSIFEALGATVSWDEKTGIVVATKGDIAVDLQIGSSVAFINNKKVNLDSPIKNVQGKIVVPVRFVSESLGATVKWNEKEKRVVISQEEEM